MRKVLRNQLKRARKVNPTIVKDNLNSAKPEAVRVLARVLTGDGMRSVTNTVSSCPHSPEQLQGATHMAGFIGPRQATHSKVGKIERRKGKRKYVKGKVSKFNVPAGFASGKAYDKHVKSMIENPSYKAQVIATEMRQMYPALFD